MGESAFMARFDGDVCEAVEAGNANSQMCRTRTLCDLLSTVQKTMRSNVECMAKQNVNIGTFSGSISIIPSLNVLATSATE